MTCLPAASHELDQVALSPFNLTYDFAPEISLSNALAVTSIELLFVNRFAVSLTMAKAVGKISSR